MNIDVLTYYPATIIVSRLRVEENGRQDIIGPGPKPLPRIGRERVSSLIARENRPSSREEPHPVTYESAKKNFRSKLCYVEQKIRVLPVLNLNTKSVRVDSTVRY